MAGYKTNGPSPHAFTQSVINSRIIDESTPNCHGLICSSTNTVDLYASIWPQTTRFNTRREYSRLVTSSVQQWNTCYGRDGTIASKSINQENNIEALVIFKKIQFTLGSPNRYKFYSGAKKNKRQWKMWTRTCTTQNMYHTVFWTFHVAVMQINNKEMYKKVCCN